MSIEDDLQKALLTAECQQILIEELNDELRSLEDELAWDSYDEDL
jgi:hypothetical protein